MPLTEIIPKSEFFDYKDKYSADGAEEITPASLPSDQIVECQTIVKKIFSESLFPSKSFNFSLI